MFGEKRYNNFEWHHDIHIKSLTPSPFLHDTFNKRLIKKKSFPARNNGRRGYPSELLAEHVWNEDDDRVGGERSEVRV